MRLPNRHDPRSISTGLSVLLVDDSPTDTVLIDAHLRNCDRLDVSVVTASTFGEAAIRAQSELFDVIVCDLDLPDVRGTDTVLHARGAFPDVPVVVLSGCVEPDLERKLMRLGAEDVLSKDILTRPNAGRLLARALIGARDRHELEHLREQTLQSLTNLIEASPDGKLVVRPDGAVALASLRASELIGTHPDDLEGQPFPFAVNVRDPYEIRRRGTDGQDRILTVESTPLSWLGEPAFLVTMRDSTDQVGREEQLRYEATHDSLTGLPSRAAFVERLGDLMSITAERDEPLAVILIDVEQFEGITRAMGPEYGDAVVQQMAGRLTALLPSRAAVGRPDTDQLAVAVAGPTSHDALEIASHISRSLDQPYLIEETEVRCSAVVSIAWNEPACHTARELLERAEVAADIGEPGPGGIRTYDPASLAGRAFVASLHADLSAAVSEGDLTLVFQPVLGIRSGEPTGLEALCRWDHPDHGNIPPSQFIKVAEDSGLIVPLGEWVIREVCDQIVRWHEENPRWRIPPVSINLTARQLNDPHLVASLVGPLRAHGLPGSAIGVEINETALLCASATVEQALAELAREGIQVHLDDFGTGYCSLRHLRNFPISALKIDRSFITGLPDDVQALQIVRAAIALGDALGKSVIAEGVETPEQLDALRALGCNEVQGYLYARPATADAVTHWFMTAEEAAIVNAPATTGLASVTRITTQFEKQELEAQIERLRSSVSV